ncbi:hypothetical protein [Micromonospora coerulea]|uniref:hypothetical protein n=1 Tax=Micromonospora coerulea TaxID=47856 RepID=UPI0019035A78|nr:hypothetical protein [Micromonospora veneta]
MPGSPTRPDRACPVGGIERAGEEGTGQEGRARTGPYDEGHPGAVKKATTMESFGNRRTARKTTR